MVWRLLENEGGLTKEHKETLGDDRLTHRLDGFTGVKTHRIVPFKYAWFTVHLLHLNKAVF